MLDRSEVTSMSRRGDVSTELFMDSPESGDQGKLFRKVRPPCLCRTWGQLATCSAVNPHAGDGYPANVRPMARTPRTPLLGALLAVTGVALARVLAFDVPSIHHADAVTLHGFISLDRESIYRLVSDVAHVADPAPYGLIGALLIGIALVEG